MWSSSRNTHIVYMYIYFCLAATQNNCSFSTCEKKEIQPDITDKCMYYCLINVSYTILFPINQTICIIDHNMPIKILINFGIILKYYIITINNLLLSYYDNERNKQLFFCVSDIFVFVSGTAAWFVFVSCIISKPHFFCIYVYTLSAAMQKTTAASQSNI